MTDNTLIAIPVYNEKQHIRPLIQQVLKYHENILIINDGSTDGTEKILSEFTSIRTFTHKQNEGYGQSILDAFEFAKEINISWIITMDCDFQHQPKTLPQFFKQISIQKADIISGSRYLNNKNIQKVPKERLRINRNITSILNSLLRINITDAFCGFKAYRVKSLKKLRLTEKGYGLPLQLWIQARQNNLKISEINVPLIYHDSRRDFAGPLELPAFRMQYYKNVIFNELKKHDCKNI